MSAALPVLIARVFSSAMLSCIASQYSAHTMTIQWWCLSRCWHWSALVIDAGLKINGQYYLMKNSCPISKRSRITSPSNKIRHLLTAHRRRLICSSAIPDFIRHHCGHTSSRSIATYAAFFSSGFTAGKSKISTSRE